MYIPKHFEVTDWDAITQFVVRAGAVDLVTIDEAGLPVSTVLPCVWDTTSMQDGDYGTLVMHMAKSNDQWKAIKGGSPGLAIVFGAQAYVSPSNYENKGTDHRVVPTWNYQRVHLSGIVEVSEDVETLRQIVSTLTDVHESKRSDPWRVDQADSKYMEGQLKAIVAVTMHVNRVEAKDKLSQNRPLEDRVRIVADLQASGNIQAVKIAEEMEKNL